MVTTTDTPLRETAGHPSTNFARPCDHCGDRIAAVEGLDPAAWACAGCGCHWSMGFTLIRQGSRCPLLFRN